MNKKCLDCAVFLQSVIDDGNKTSIHFGTGFFMSCQVNHRNRLLIVTNRHVLEGFTTIDIRFITPEPVFDHSDPYSSITISCSDVLYYGHPDRAVDLAAITVDGVIDRLTTNVPMLYQTRVLHANDVLSAHEVEALEPFEELFTVSCTNHLKDFGIASPFLRTGILSTYPGYNKNLLLLDVPCFPGYSGSPVFQKSSGKLIGVVKGGVTMSHDTVQHFTHQAIAIKASLLDGIAHSVKYFDQ